MLSLMIGDIGTLCVTIGRVCDPSGKTSVRILGLCFNWVTWVFAVELH